MIQMSGLSLAYDLCLLLAYNRYKLSGVDTCVVVAALVHFFSLSTQLWMTIAAHCLRTALAHDWTVSDNCSALCKRLLIAWGGCMQHAESRFTVERHINTTKVCNSNSLSTLINNISLVLCSRYLLLSLKLQRQ